MRHWLVSREAAREQGYHVSGIEVGRQLAEFTSDRLGIAIHNVPLTELPSTESFDVITYLTYWSMSLTPEPCSAPFALILIRAASLCYSHQILIHLESLYCESSLAL
jgi:hypothetical protein